MTTHTTIEILRRLRDRGMSQQEISRQSKISQPTLSKWLNGQVPRAADAALRLRDLDHTLPAGDASPGPSSMVGSAASA